MDLPPGRPAPSLAPRRALTLSAILAALFVTLFVLVERLDAVTRLDARVGRAVRALASDTGTAAFRVISDLGYDRPMTVLAVATGALLALAGRRAEFVAWAGAVGGGSLAVRGLKALAARARPAFDGVVDTWSSPSFPSGHAFGSLVCYGLLVYLVAAAWPGASARRAAYACAGVFVLLVGLSRLYLGAHYLSDVLAGFAAGGAWLLAWIAALETWRRRAGPVAAATQAPGSA